ncbi:MAG: MarR family transcriptional regulator [Bdellovibrionales bacterium]|nr:MarR family transcriptional regulator [Bdellovibrionales bacterium]
MINILPPTMGWLRQKVSENSEPELTLPQFRILANIDSGLTTVTLIAKHQGVTQPAMSQMVENLINKKLIIKKINPNDKRQSLLRLSKKGQSWLNQIIAAVKTDVAQQFSGLSKLQQKKIKEALILLNTHLGENPCDRLS